MHTGIFSAEEKEVFLLVTALKDSASLATVKDTSNLIFRNHEAVMPRQTRFQEKTVPKSAER